MEVFDTFALSTFPTIRKTGEKSETDRITQANFSLKKKKKKTYNFLFIYKIKVVNFQKFTSIK